MAISLKFSDFRKWPVAQKLRGKFFFLEGKIFFYFFYTGQRSFWHAPELSSPTGSTLELRLKMVKNQGFTM